jgi:DNA-binding PadR family transcriptional regulator
MARYLGEFEQVVLLAALHLGEAAYGAGVSEAIAGRTGRRVSRGALYVTLDRLEAKGLIRSRLADPSPARGGRPRRYVEVTGPGLRALRESRAVLLDLWRGLEDRLEAR